jgi:hypothetical protein
LRVRIQFAVFSLNHFEGADATSDVAPTLSVRRARLLQVKGFVPEDFVARKDVKKMDRFIQFAMAAPRFTTTQAAIQVTPRAQIVSRYSSSPHLL